LQKFHHLEVLDVQGRLLESGQVEFKANRSINTSAYAPGTYFLKIKSEGVTSTMIFIKE